MKDIVITGKTIGKEIRIFVGCFVAALIVNIISIIKYDRPWTEIVSMIGYEILITLVLYFLLALVRLLVLLCRKLLKK